MFDRIVWSFRTFPQRIPVSASILPIATILMVHTSHIFLFFTATSGVGI